MFLNFRNLQRENGFLLRRTMPNRAASQFYRRIYEPYGPESASNYHLTRPFLYSLGVKERGFIVVHDFWSQSLPLCGRLYDLRLSNIRAAAI